jgi:hypothetical protein
MRVRAGTEPRLLSLNKVEGSLFRTVPGCAAIADRPKLAQIPFATLTHPLSADSPEPRGASSPQATGLSLSRRQLGRTNPCLRRKRGGAKWAGPLNSERG